MGKKLFIILILFICLTQSSCAMKQDNLEPIDACVEITINDKIFSSGFFINDLGNILTSAHSFNGLYDKNNISINANIIGKTYQLMLISIDFNKDIAMLKCDIAAPKYLSLDSYNTAKCDYAYVMGNAYGKGIVSTKVQVIYESIKICTDTKSYQGAIFEGEIALGLSGAPVLGENGNFLGMVIGKGAKNNQMYALSLSEINIFLKESV
jgi:hypothetical protein